MAQVKKKFTKPPFSRQQLIDLMKRRGLPLPSRNDEAVARDAIAKIGYYRLSGFMIPFQKGGQAADKHDFKAGTTLDQILKLYQFDKDLKLCIGSALDSIEVAFRTSVCDHMCRSTKESHWILNDSNFRLGLHGRNWDAFRHSIQEHSSSESLASYYSNYDDPQYPPSWMMRDFVSFGKWSKLFGDLHSKDQKSISDDWLYPKENRIDHVILAKWIQALVILRNRCAHQDRITNRVFAFSATPSTDPSVAYLFSAQDKDLRTLLVIVAILLKNVEESNHWLEDVYKVFETHDALKVDVAGSAAFASDWKADPIWSF